MEKTSKSNIAGWVVFFAVIALGLWVLGDVQLREPEPEVATIDHWQEWVSAPGGQVAARCGVAETAERNSDQYSGDDLTMEGDHKGLLEVKVGRNPVRLLVPSIKDERLTSYYCGLYGLCFSTDGKKFAVYEGYGWGFPDGRVLVYSCDSASVTLDKVIEGAVSRDIHDEGSDEIGALAFSPSGRYLMAGLRVVDLQTGRIRGAEEVVKAMTKVWSPTKEDCGGDEIWWGLPVAISLDWSKPKLQFKGAFKRGEWPGSPEIVLAIDLPER